MLFANHHNMVKALASNRSNDPFGISVLPRRAGRNDRLPNVQRLGLTRKSFTIRLGLGPESDTGALLQRARLEQLARRPFRGRVFRHIEMHQPAPAVREHHEHEQDSKGCRGHREEIQGD